MDYKFQPSLPDNYKGEPILISGIDSANHKVIYLVINDTNNQNIYEIRYEWHTGPFSEVLLIDDLIAVGFEEFFYLFDTALNELVLKIKMDFYFGSLYYHEKLFYIADACHIFCIAKSGNIIWETDNLAIDGVIINKFINDKIYVQGENDPPGGWEDFILDIKTGQILKN